MQRTAKQKRNYIMIIKILLLMFKQDNDIGHISANQ